jgi:hypothetical protein
MQTCPGWIEPARRHRIGTASAVAPAVEVAEPLADIAAVLTGHERLRTQEMLPLLATPERATYVGVRTSRHRAAGHREALQDVRRHAGFRRPRG